MEGGATVGRRTASLFVANVTSLIANTLYYVLLTNLLHSTLEVGVITSLNILIWFLVVVCVFAQPVVYVGTIPAPLAVLKFVPEFFIKNDRGAAAKVFRTSLFSCAILGFIVVGVLCAVPSLVIPLLGGEAILPEYIRLSAIDILVISVGQVCLGTVIALGDIDMGGLYIIIWSIVRYALASILLLPYSVVGVLIGWICGDFTLLLLALRRSSRNFRGQTGASNFSGKDLARYSLYTLFAALIGFVINQADRLITLSEQGLSRLAIYNVAMAAASLASYAPYALVTVLIPAVTALFASKPINELRGILRSYTRYVSLFVMPMAFGLAAVMQIPLRIFGADYLSGILPAVIVSVATGLTALGAVYSGALLALGKLRWYTAANLLGLLSLFLVAVTLTPLLGLNGPALGRASLLIVATIVYGLAALKAGIYEIDSRAYFCSVGGAALMALAIFGLISVIESFLLRIVMLPVLVLIGLLIYVGSLRVFRFFTINDIDFIRDLMPNRFRVLLPVIIRLTGLEYAQPQVKE